MKRSMKKIIACCMALILVWGQIFTMFAYDLSSFDSIKEKDNGIIYNNPSLLQDGTEQKDADSRSSVSENVYSEPIFEISQTQGDKESPDSSISISQNETLKEENNLSEQEPIQKSVQESVYQDDTVPPASTGLRVMYVDFTFAELEWEPAYDNVGVAEYEIYRNGMIIGTTENTYYKDIGLIPGTEYTYHVKAKDAAGNISEMSDAVTALTTFDNESPTKPENLTATAVLNTSVTLTWTAATDNVKVAGYKILRDGVLVGVVREGVSFTDTGLKADTTYVYTVISFDLSDNSSVTSEPLSVTTAVVISNGLTLDNDMTFDAVVFTGGTINLNGYKLTIKRGLTQTGGTMRINGGQLIVLGDYRIDNGNYYCYAYLNMTKSEDYVYVGGDFLTKAYYSHKNSLTAGTLEVKGNFTEGTYSSTYSSSSANFKATGNHKVVLSGEGLQTVNFAYPNNSYFNVLEIKNSSNEGVKFASSYNVMKLISNGNMVDISTIGDISIKLQEDLTVKNGFKLTGNTLDLNGYTLTVNGNITQAGGTMKINGGQLIVLGDYKIDNGNYYCNAYLNMTNEADYVYVEGDFLTKAYYSHEGSLTAGTLEVKGNFTEGTYSSSSANFKATGNHKVVLSGEGLQTVNFVYPYNSYFNVLEIKNSSDEGVKFATSFNAISLVNNGIALDIATAGATNIKLSEDLIIKSDFKLTGSTIDLNGYKLTVKGNFIHSGGTMKINGGKLIVKGDYKIDNGNYYCYAYLNMTNEADYVYVGGNFLTKAYYGHEGSLTAGTLEVKGDFTEGTYASSSANFKATGSHKVVLSGEGLQTVNFAYPNNSYFNVLEIKNSSDEGVKFASSYNVMKLISNGNKVDISTIGDISIKLQEDLTVKNGFRLTGNTLDLNGYTLTVNGSITQAGGTMKINGGQLIVLGDYKIDNGNYYCYAYLNMTNEADYVYVEGDFLTKAYYSHEGSLTAGILEVKGDFTESGYASSSANFKATGTHKVVLSGEELQTVNFVYPSNSYFNILQITKPVGAGYSFNTKPVWKQLEEITVDEEPPTVPSDLKVIDKSHYTVTLSWESSSDNIRVSGYYVYRDGILVGDTSTNVFTDRGLTPETSYTYEVRAYDVNKNQSQSSNSVKADTDSDPEPPSVPTGIVTVSKTDTTITISWEASTDNVGVKGYVIYRDRKEVGTVSELTFTDTGLSPSTIYAYQIKAFDEMGNYSDFSYPMYEKTKFDAQEPTVPQNLKVDDVTAASVKISWDKSQDNYNVKGYEVYRDDKVIGTTSETFFTDVRLEPETTYKYNVRAYDEALNYSGVSDSVYAVTLEDVEAPSIPLNISLKSKNASSVTITWEKSTDNVAVKCYNIYRDGKLIYTTEMNVYTDSGLVKNKSYSYTITALDTSGNESKPSSPFIATPGVPNAPKGLVANPGIYSVELLWEPVTSEGQSYYRIYSGTETINIEYKLDVKSGVKGTVNGLNSDTTYYFMVSAVDIWGNEGPKTLISCKTLGDTEAPYIKSLQPAEGTRTSDRNIKLSAVGVDNGVISKFIFEYSFDEDDKWVKIAEVNAAFNSDKGEYVGETIWNNGGIDGKFKYRVTAVDKEGNISQPNINSIILDYLPPLVPQGVSVLAEPGRNVITWNKVESEDISKYGIYRKTADGNFKKINTVNENVLKYIDYDSQVGETYFYAVSSIDDLNNESELSEAIQVTTIKHEPTVVLTPEKGGPETELLFKGKGFKPLETVELYIDGMYLINGKADENGDVTVLWRYTKNVTPGNHIFTIKGKTSLAQGVAGFTAEVELPFAPDNITSVPGQLEIKLSWNAPKNSSIGHYRVYRSVGTDAPVLIFDNVKTLSVKDIDVSKDTEYGYSVSTVDIYGNEGEKSKVVYAEPLPDTDRPVINDFKESRSGSIIKLTAGVKDNIGVSSLKLRFRPVNGQWKELATIDVISQRNTIVYPSYDWETNEIPDGYYEVGAIAYDGAGNLSFENIITVRVKNTPPDAPTELKAQSDEMKIELSWNGAEDKDVEKYKLFRSTDGGDFQVVATTGLLSYIDNKVMIGKNYTYKIVSVDKFGQESAASKSVTATPKEDKTAPVIVGFEPLEGTVFGRLATITVRAEDNVEVLKTTLQYSVDGGINWIDAGSVDLQDTSVFKWDTSSLSGEVKVRAIAKDSSGNISNGLPVLTYQIDTEGPSRVTGLSAIPSINAVTLKWNSVPDSDFAYFQVERKDSQNGIYYSIGTSSNILGLNVTGLDPDTSYWFRVVCFDIFGNRGKESEEIKVTTLKDSIAPTVNSIEPRPGNYNTTIPLRGTVSDNTGVLDITFQYSADRKTWNNIETISIQGSPKSASASCSLDVSSLAEGIIYVRIVARDIYGNTSKTDSSASYVEYKVDHTAPIKASGLTATSSTGSITLQWTKGTEDDIAYYNVYRSENENGQYSIIGNVAALWYRDRNVMPAKKYYYKVSAVDAAGNEGELSDPVSEMLKEDNEAPQILSFNFPDNSTLPANPTIRVLASDNYMLSKVVLEYKAADEQNDKWKSIGSVEVDTYSSVASFKWDTSALIEGKYVVRAYAQDANGLKSEYKLMNYYLNLNPPEVPKLTLKPGGWKIDLSWEKILDEDLAGYRIYRKDGEGSSYKKIKETTYTNYSDELLNPSITYYYKLEAVDIYGNSSFSEECSASPTREDLYKPVARAGEDITAALGKAVAFDGSKSTDNDGISSYQWDFGDGGKAQGPKPLHAYTQCGEYTVTLAVYDPAGNVGVDTIKVSVIDYSEIETLKIKVVDETTGAPIPGADLFTVMPDGQIIKGVADSNGIMTVTGKTGTCKVSAYKEEYKPAYVEASLVKGKECNVTVKLKRGQLVVGNLTVRRLQLDEIKELGINVSSPDNQFVYKYEIKLAFNDTLLPTQELVVNGKGELINDWKPVRIKDSDGVQYTAYPKVISHPDHPEVRPTVAYMVIPAQASMLKEFFEVTLTLENTADPQFEITDSSATLKIPQGLEFVPTDLSKSLTVDLGVLSGGQNRTVKWVIKGNKEGSYDLEAEFNGILQPFEKPVKTIFRTSEPFKVWGGSAVEITVEAEEIAYSDTLYSKGSPYYVRFGVKNISDIDVNKFKLVLQDGENFKFKAGQQLENTIEVLKPGQTKWFEYWIIPELGFKGYLDIKNSVASGDGIKWKFVRIRVGRGDGLRGLYFDGDDFQESKLYRVDPEINFNWGYGSPDSSINKDKFSVRWFGDIMPKLTEPMTIRVDSNQSVRLWIDGEKLIDTWWDTAEKTGNTCTISSDKMHSIQLEILKNKSGSSGVTLYWSGESYPEEVIPGRYLYSESQYDRYSKDISAVLVISKADRAIDEKLLSGAKVTIADMGYSGTTDEKGIAVLKASDKTHRVRVEMDGYYPYEVDTDFSVTPLKIVYMQKILPGFESAPYIEAAFLEKDGETIDLSGYQHTIEIDKMTYTKINIPVNWNGHGQGEIRLYHGDKYVSAVDGVINRQLGIDFKEEGNDAYLIAIAGDGSRSQPFTVRLNFDKIERENLGGNLSLPTDQMEITTPQNNNMLSEETLGFSIGPVEVNIEDKGNKRIIEFGYKLIDENEFNSLKDYFENPSYSLEYDDTELELDTDLEDFYERMTDFIDAKKLLKDLNAQKVNYSINDKFKAGLLLGGYIEAVQNNDGKWVVSEGGLLMIGDGSIDFGQQFMVGPVPIFVKFGVGAELKFKTGVKANTSVDGTNNSIHWSGCTFDLELEFKPEVGLGIADVASVSLQGNVTLNLAAKFDPSFSWAGSIQFGLSIILKLLVFEYKKSMVESDPYYFKNFDDDKKRANSINNLAMDDIYKVENYSVSSRDYLKEPSIWLGNQTFTALPPSDGMNASYDRKQVLMENIYPEANPKIVNSGDDNVLLWLADQGDRNSVNRTELVYSVKNDEGGYTEPKSVYDDGTGDFYHDISSDGKNVFVAWQNIGEEFEESDVTIESFSKASEIMVSRFNNETKSFDKPVSLTNDDVLDMNPSISVSNNKAFVAWLRNDANDIFGISGRNDIMYSIFDGTKWSTPKAAVSNAGLVISLSTAYKDNNAYVIYSVDTDGDIFTLEDREIYYCVLEGEAAKMPVRLTDNNTIDSKPQIFVKDDKVSALWYVENNLKYVDDLSKPEAVDMFSEPLQGLNDSFEVVTDGNELSLLLIKEDQNGIKDVYSAIYDNDTGIISNFVNVTNGSERVKTVSGAYDEKGDLVLVFNMAKRVETQSENKKYYIDGSNDLYVSKVVKEYNISIVEDSVNWNEYQFKPGNPMNVTFDVENRGTEAVNKIKIEAYYEDPRTKEVAPFYIIEKEGYIRPGDKESITVEFVPEEYRMYNVFYKVSVVDGHDIDESDNYAQIDTGYCDVEVDSIKVIGDGDDTTLMVLLKNNSGITAQNINLVLTEDSLNGKKLYEKQFEKLEMGDTALAFYNFNIKDLKCTNGMGKIYAYISTESEEKIKGNNWDYAVLFDPDKKIPFEVTVSNAVCEENSYITADLEIKNIYDDKVAAVVTTELYDKETGNLIEKKQQSISLNSGESIVITEQFTKDVPYEGNYFIKAYVERSEESNNIPSEVIELSNTVTAVVKTISDDKTPPVITWTASSEPNKNGWYNSDVTIHFEAKDDISGIDILTPDTTISQEGMDISFTAVAIDKAGNASSIEITGINIDKTKPEIVYNMPDTKNFGERITLSFEAIDNLSGIESSYVLFNGEKYSNGAVVMLIRGGDNKIEFIAEDKAGNVSCVTKTLTVIAPKFKVSGYVAPSFMIGKQSPSVINSGFTVEIVGTGLSAITDDRGYFEIKDVPMSIDYTLKISKQNYLSREIKDVVVSEDVKISTYDSPVEMWAGDIAVNGVQDGAINMLDVVAMAKLYNTWVGEPDYDESFDFNMDKAINLIDIVIMAVHFGCFYETAS